MTNKEPAESVLELAAQIARQKRPTHVLVNAVTLAAFIDAGHDPEALGVILVATDENGQPLDPSIVLGYAGKP